jgi:hypothetical protein
MNFATKNWKRISRVAVSISFSLSGTEEYGDLNRDRYFVITFFYVTVEECFYMSFGYSIPR